MKDDFNRRDFFRLTFTAGAGLAFLPLFDLDAQRAGACVAKFGQPLRNLGEIPSSGGFLRGVIDLRVEPRAVTYYNAPVYSCVQPTLRTYHGYKGWNVDPNNRVTLPGVAYPGPLLRARVGETVELIFLNRIDAEQFPTSSVTSSRGRCDESRNLDGTPKYPGKDVFPNCFHASNTSNLHFHGTHVSPGTVQDNVLVGVIPNPKLDATAAIATAEKMYEAWRAGEDPLPEFIVSQQRVLESLLEQAKKDNNNELVEQITEALHTNQTLIEHQEWPQYWPGFYPHRFELPLWTKGGPYKMGQSPGTHWYHCHQHGSTTMQILNGMAGVFVITGDYDDKILSLGGGTPAAPKIKEQVLLFQLFAEQPNLVNASPTVTTMACNGQVLPTLTMKKNEVQWWRIANAAMRSHGTDAFLFVAQSVYDDLVKNPSKMKNGVFPVSPDGSIPSLNQTAQDGVQFAWENYQANSNLKSIPMAPGNRADFLVKAPATAGTSYLVFWPPAGTAAIKDIRQNTVFKLVVSGDPTGVNTDLPTEKDQYPVQPDFLTDVTDAEVHGRKRTVTFSASSGPGTQPVFKIDGEQFNEGIIDQVMLLGNAEEWTVENTSLFGIMHPFHIHINPFQLLEMFDPNTMTAPQVFDGPWIWWDTLSIPAGKQKTNSDGTPATLPDGTPDVTPGYFKMRTRFVDFPGKYVLHCHILGHEDRGMMQLVEVVDNKTVVKHH